MSKVEWKELKEVFDTRNGYTPSTSNETFWEGGYIPWFKMEDIRDNGSILNDSYLHITDKAIKDPDSSIQWDIPDSSTTLLLQG